MTAANVASVVAGALDVAVAAFAFIEARRIGDRRHRWLALGPRGEASSWDQIERAGAEVAATWDAIAGWNWRRVALLAALAASGLLTVTAAVVG